MKKNLGDMLLPGPRAVLRTTKDVLYAGIHRFLEGLDLGVGLFYLPERGLKLCRASWYPEQTHIVPWTEMGQPR